MTVFNQFKKVTGALALAVVVGATAVGVAPAQAQGFSFGIDGGPGAPSFSFGFGNDRDWRPRWRDPGRITCMSERSLERALEREGYRRVEVDVRGRFALAYATYRGVPYRLEMTCAGRILDRQRLRR